jgi:hypothetical protein
MKRKASILTLRMPVNLKLQIEKIADQQGVSLNQLALYIFTKEIQELETAEYFAKYLHGKSKKKIISDFDSVLEKVATKEIPQWDKM